MADARLVVELPELKVDLETFLEATTALLAVIREVDSNLSPTDHPRLKWVVSKLKKGSVYLEATPEVDGIPVEGPEIDRILATTRDGLACLRKGPEIPRHFSDVALAQTRRLSTLLATPAAKKARVLLGGKPVQITSKIEEHIAQATAPKGRSLGTIEGRLETLSIHGRPKFVVFERLHRTSVSCYFDFEDWDALHNAFGRRVLVRGIIHTRSNGTPVSVRVRVAEDLTVFPPDTALPSASTVRGILRHG